MQIFVRYGILSEPVLDNNIVNLRLSNLSLSLMKIRNFSCLFENHYLCFCVMFGYLLNPLKTGVRYFRSADELHENFLN